MRLTKKDKKQIGKWVEALYSGEYKQTKWTLENEFGYCCLGVACKVLIPRAELRFNHEGYLRGGIPEEYEQPGSPRWLQLINGDVGKLLRDDGSLSLSSLNDDDDYSFEEIGMLIQAIYLEGVLE